MLHIDGSSDTFAFRYAQGPSASFHYEWAGSGLDWSSESEVTLRLREAATASSDATLSALTVTAGGSDLVTFASGTTDYTASVANDVAEVTVTAETTDSGATVAYLDVSDMTLDDADTTADDFQVTLAVGDNVIKVTVTAEDTNATETYTVTVSRAAADAATDAPLSGLTVTAGGTAQTLSPTFTSTVHYYTVPVANTVTEITITPEGHGTVAYEDADGTALPDANTTSPGQQVTIPTAGKRINVVVTHTDGGNMVQETYGVLLIRKGPAVQDTIALMALYNSAGGDNWTKNTNWGSAAPLDSWYRVETNRDGNVTVLGLYSNGLSGTIPGELGSLTNLEWLQLNENQLTGAIPTELGSLANLTLLWLNENQLTGEIPTVLGNLTNLTGLSLDDNQLTGEIPTELGNLTNLTGLFLEANQLTGKIPTELGNLSLLTELWLRDNRLTGAIPTELGSLTSLTVLYLRDNQLTGEIPGRAGQPHQPDGTASAQEPVDGGDPD